MSGEAPGDAHPRFRIWRRADGIVQVVLTPGVPLAFADAVAITEAIAEVSGGKQCLLLADVREASATDRPGRLEFGRRVDLVSAVALIVGGPLSRMMGNLLNTVNPSKTPLRMFDDEATAVAWLQELDS